MTLTTRERLDEWWFDLKDRIAGLGPDIRIHHHKHKGDLEPGTGYAGPMRRLYQQCCRCGRFRIGGKFVEMYGSELRRGWRYECLDCTLEEMEALYQSVRPPKPDA